MSVYERKRRHIQTCKHQNKPQKPQRLLETEELAPFSVSEKQRSVPNTKHHREYPCQETFSHLRQLHFTPEDGQTLTPFYTVGRASKLVTTVDLNFDWLHVGAETHEVASSEVLSGF